MTPIYRCPKCGASFSPPRPEHSECPHCGLWFHKWAMVAGDDVADRAAPAPDGDCAAPADADPWSWWGRAATLVLVAVWGVVLARLDYAEGEINASFMHDILLPIHEAGHVFFRPFGEFLTIAGGSVFQVALPLAIAAAFLLRQRDPFAAAICLWWAGASMVDLAPYIWDALEPKLMLLGGHTGEDGPHDWIYLLTRLGRLHRAHAWGVAAHHLGVLMMAAGVGGGGRSLWQGRPGRGNGRRA